MSSARGRAFIKDVCLIVLTLILYFVKMLRVGPAFINICERLLLLAPVSRAKTKLYRVIKRDRSFEQH